MAHVRLNTAGPTADGRARQDGSGRDGGTVSAGTPVGALYPLPAGTTPTSGYGSGTTGSVATTVSSPNPFPVTITTATIGAVTTTPLTGRTCAAGSVLPTTGAPITLPAHSAPTAVTVPGALYMVSTAEDGCQRATFTVPVTVTGASA